MRQHLLLSFALIFLSSCTSVPNYSKSWATSNCQSIGYFTADTNQYSIVFSIMLVTNIFAHMMMTEVIQEH